MVISKDIESSISKERRLDAPATVKTIEYDPNRNARIALVEYTDGEKAIYYCSSWIYKLDRKSLVVRSAAPEIGNTLKLGDMPLGTIVHNIELYPGQGGKFARSAGTYAQLTAKEGKYAVLKMPSERSKHGTCNMLATVGTVSNSEHFLERSW